MKLPIEQDRIEKQIELKAPVARVWRALTDYREFSEWFGVNLEGPFVPGQTSRGQITITGYEHLKWEAVVEKMEPERLFSFTWHPYAIDPQKDYSQEPSTLVEFRLEPKGGGTLLTLTESGFSKLPAERRDEAFRMNDGGWTEQMKNIESHVRKRKAPSPPAKQSRHTRGRSNNHDERPEQSRPTVTRRCSPSADSSSTEAGRA